MEPTPFVVKTLTGHPHESHIPWHFTLVETPGHSNFWYRIKIEDPIEGLIQEIYIRNGIRIEPKDFELWGIRPGGLLCIRVKGGVCDGESWYKTWMLDIDTNKFVFSPSQAEGSSESWARTLLWRSVRDDEFTEQVHQSDIQH